MITKTESNDFMIKIKKPKFNIYDRVYHITLDSKQGVVMDSIYSSRNDSWRYEVTFDCIASSLEYYEDELL